MKRILDYLPPLYRHLLPALFRQGIPTESLSTCRRCAMCRRPGQRRDPGVKYFRPDARCCTFYPSLPNYLAGALLEDRSAGQEEGRQRVRRLIARGTGAGLLGLEAPPARQRRYARLGDRGFGRMRSLLCPYFRPGANDCSIWGFRNGTCATYFCCPVRGVHGASFWEAVYHYLTVLERALARHALEALQERQDLEALYRQAYRIVARLGSAEVARIAGEPGRAALRAVRTARRRMLSDAVPRRLRPNPGLLAFPRREEVFLQVPKHLVFSLSRGVWEAVLRFDGSRDRGAVVREVRCVGGLGLPKEFLLALYRAGILEESNSKRSGPCPTALPSCRASCLRRWPSGPWRRPSCSAEGP